MRRVVLFFGALFLLPLVSAQERFVSKVWVADRGDGTYRNPVIDADYSDPDLCRVGDDYFLTASSFNCLPGLPILHSRDLVNWRIVNHALKRWADTYQGPAIGHGKGVWAPSIRYHRGMFYIFYGDPDLGVMVLTATDPMGEWSSPVNVKPGAGIIDPCPLWDYDGRLYVVHGYAGSRAGTKSVLGIFELDASLGSATSSRIVYDGHEEDPTVEGPKFYKRGGYYYIFAPAGGVATGWQIALRSKTPYGPYERRVVMAEGSTAVNGPHQGGWVTTAAGEDWFMHFQDKFFYGRVVHLQPMQWTDGWPVIGVDLQGKGCGEPVETFRKPRTSRSYPVSTPADSDEFNSPTLGLQWQWHAAPSPLWYFCHTAKGLLRLYSAENAGTNLWDAGNLLLQKTPTDEFTATAKVDFHPLRDKPGEEMGLVVMGRNYATLAVTGGKDGWTLSQNVCMKADGGGREVSKGSVGVAAASTLYLRVEVRRGGMCTFSYSTDNVDFKVLGSEFKGREGLWIGAKVGLYITRPFRNNDSGWVDVDWFRVE